MPIASMTVLTSSQFQSLSQILECLYLASGGLKWRNKRFSFVVSFDGATLRAPHFGSYYEVGNHARNRNANDLAEVIVNAAILFVI